MTVTFIQTADAHRYSQMLDWSSRTVKSYVKLRGLRYEAFIGLKRGGHPWHATFNRIFMLEDLIERGVGGWVCYLDADAWLVDKDFDVVAYLADKSQFAAIFTPSGSSDHRWDVNAGVFFLNLDHPDGFFLAKRWHQAVLEQWFRIGDVTDFPVGGPDDQSLLHELLLAEVISPDSIHLASRDLINSQYASFIQQHLRADQNSFEERVAFIRDRTEDVLALWEQGQPTGDRDERAWDVIEALYHGLLLRGPDGDIENPYYRLIRFRGMREGVESACRSISDSQEFREKRRRPPEL